MSYIRNIKKALGWEYRNTKPEFDLNKEIYSQFKHFRLPLILLIKHLLFKPYEFFLRVLSSFADILIFLVVPSSNVILTVLKFGKNLLFVLFLA